MGVIRCRNNEHFNRQKEEQSLFIKAPGNQTVWPFHPREGQWTAINLPLQTITLNYALLSGHPDMQPPGRRELACWTITIKEETANHNRSISALSAHREREAESRTETIEMPMCVRFESITFWRTLGDDIYVDTIKRSQYALPSFMAR